MRFCVLASGSNANCTFVEGGGTRILIDCGLSCAELARRLSKLAAGPESLDAIVVTHEHSDHIAGIAGLSARYNLPVYASAITARQLAGVEVSNCFTVGEAFRIGRLDLLPFSVPHDAVDPAGLVIGFEGLRLGQATDLGKITPAVYEALAGCHALILEFNHDEEMLWDCGYPRRLKKRIASAQGHLSNREAAVFLAEIRDENLQHLVLAHLSAHSNTPQAAMSTLERYLEFAGLKSVVCASRHAATGILKIAARGEHCLDPGGEAYDSTLQPA